MRRVVLCIFITGFLSSCMDFDSSVQTELSIPDKHYVHAENFEGEGLDCFEKWWEPLLEHEPLQRLWHLAKTNNHDIEIAKERLREVCFSYGLDDQETEDRLQNKQSDCIIRELPRDARSIDDMIFRSYQFGKVMPSTVGFQHNYTTTLLHAVFEIDLFGQHKYFVEAAKEEIYSLEEVIKDVSFWARAELTKNYLMYKTLTSRLEKYREHQQEHLDLVSKLEKRVQVGVSSAQDLSHAQKISAALDKKIEELENRLLKELHMMSRWTGVRDLEEIRNALEEETENPLIHLSTSVLTGTPLEVVQNRPDLKVQWNLLNQAAHLVGLQISHQFPKFFLSATLETSAEALSEMLKAQNLTYALGTSIYHNIFQRWKTYAKTRQYISRYKQLVQEYNRGITHALADVADNMLNVLTIDKKVDQMQKHEKDAVYRYEQAKVRAKNDGKSIADWIEMGFEKLQAEEETMLFVLEKDKQVLDLIRSLGG